MATLSDDDIRGELGSFLPRRAEGSRGSLMGVGNDDLEEGRRYLAAAAAGGWAVPTWPAGHGGRGAGPDDAAAVARIAKEFAIPDLYVYAVGLGMVGPCLLAHGTEAQQRRWLSRIADGSEIWCQMFSEPEAGSDLANVATRAARDGDEWVFDGQKVWTSRGTWARWGLCLARTDPSVPKHRGLTMFAVDMEQDGIEVRPLVQMNGDKHFSEVFLTSARVPDDARIGDVGAGWNVAMTVLAHERAGVSGSDEAAGTRVPSWLRSAARQGWLADPLRRHSGIAAYVVGEVERLTSMRNRQEAASGRPGPAGSGAKLRTVQRYKAETYFTKNGAGPSGLLSDTEGHMEFLTAPSMSIRGGTDEIQRNILGERVLGLPAEPRVDRNIPWSEARRGVV